MTNAYAKLQERLDSLAGVVYPDPVEKEIFFLGQTKANSWIQQNIFLAIQLDSLSLAIQRKPSSTLRLAFFSKSANSFSVKSLSQAKMEKYE